MTEIADIDRLASGRFAAGRRGAVAAGHPVAAYAGLRILDAGGNAVDACLAAAALCWVVMPDMCGPGGDLFAVVHTPDGRVQAINGAGPAPARDFPPEDPEDRGALCLVPGALPAFVTLRETLGRLPLAEIFAPALAVAETGFVAGRRLVRQIEAIPPGRFRDELSALWGGELPGVGDIVHCPPLTAALRRFAEGAAPMAIIAEALPEWRARGVRLSADDLARYGARLEEALSLRLGAWAFHGQPPMSQAVATLSALGTAGLDVMGHPDCGFREHMLIESYKRAYEGLTELGDGGDSRALCRRMLAPAHMRRMRERIGPAATTHPPMIRNYGETTQCAAVDADGRLATVTHSLYRPFGARVLSPETGLFANDRGGSFSDGANAATAGGLPRHTLVNVVAVHADGDVFALGTPGAQAQAQTTLQVLARLVRDRDAVRDAVLAPRWSFIGGDRIAIEAAMPSAISDNLLERGHGVALRPPHDWLMGSVSLAAWRNGVCQAVADHRREALALAL